LGFTEVGGVDIFGKTFQKLSKNFPNFPKTFEKLRKTFQKLWSFWLDVIDVSDCSKKLSKNFRKTRSKEKL
jgi:hypothetical protein